MKPIILIPGIQGTTLSNVNEKDFISVWTGGKKFYSNIWRLRLQKDGISDLGEEIIVERSDVEDLAYQEIIDYLREKGYKVYIFGYDWRKSNVVSAQKLATFVEGLKKKLRIESFNFLTHSMGALVLSAYLKQMSAEAMDKTVNKIVFTVPPFLGSVEASLNLTLGRSKLFNSAATFRKVAVTFPAIYELLPVYEGAYEFAKPVIRQNFDRYDYTTYWQEPRDGSNPEKVALITHRLQELEKVRNQNDFIFDFSNCDQEFLKKVVVVAGGDSNTKDKIYVEDRKKTVVVKNFLVL